MPVISRVDAMKFATEWIDAWNAHDLDAILAHYTQDFEFSSPLILEITGEPSGCLHGQEAIRPYWAKGLANLPELHFRLIDVLAGVGSLTLYYRGHISTVAESFHFDPEGKVFKSMSSYSVFPSAAPEHDHG